MPEVVELYVVMYCEACAASVKRAVKKIPGVHSYKIDYYAQKVTVIGDVDREDVWRRIHKTGKRVTLIPKPAPPKQEPQEEKKEETKEEKKEVKTAENQETKVEETTTDVKVVDEKKQEETKEGTKAVDTKEEVEAHETKQQVVTVVETKEEKSDEAQVGSGQEEKKKPERPWPKPEWVPMFVTAPYYTLPSTFY